MIYLSRNCCILRRQIVKISREPFKHKPLHTTRTCHKVRRPPILDKQKEAPSIDLPGILFLAAPLATFCLGVWQYNRRQWKIDLIQQLDNKVNRAPAVDLPDDLTEVVEMEYRRVKVRGSFDHSEELYIGPRSFIGSSGGSSGGLITFGGNPHEKVGWHVITPFALEEGDTRILVNRGFVPGARMDPQKRPGGQVGGTVDLVGVLRLSELRNSMTPANKEETRRWSWRDIPAIAQKLKTSQVLIDQDLETSAVAARQGGPVGGQTRISLTNDHFQYMVTWFGASAATTYLWVRRYIYRR